jgi:hypothetical protein
MKPFDWNAEELEYEIDWFLILALDLEGKTML